MDPFQQLFFWILKLDYSWVLKPSHDSSNAMFPINSRHQIRFLLTKELEYYENERFIGYLKAPNQWLQRGVFMQIFCGISPNPQEIINATANFDIVYIIELTQYYSLSLLFDVILNKSNNQNFSITSQYIKNQHILHIKAK